MECRQRHIHAFTHYARWQEAAPAIAYAESTGWMPEDGMPVYAWERIPALADDFARNSIPSYFPLYQVTAP
jgi:hypothetical protein